MTISDKIRIYELSRDLNLENKDILDAAQKLSISVKSHSSSISAGDAKKIKNLINKKNSDKKILSINKPSIPKDNYKQTKENKSPIISPEKEKSFKDNANKKQFPISLKILINPAILPVHNLKQILQIKIFKANLHKIPTKIKKISEIMKPHLSKIPQNLLFN